MLGLDPDHPATAAAQDRAAKIADEVFGFFGNFDVAIADHPEGSGTRHGEIGEDPAREVAQHRFYRHEPAAGQLEKTRHGGWQHDQFAHLLAVVGAAQIEQQAKTQIGNERKRVRRIERLRGEDREQLLGKEAVERGLCVRRDLPDIEHDDAPFRQCGAQAAPQRLLVAHQTGGVACDQLKRLSRGQPIE